MYKIIDIHEEDQFFSENEDLVGKQCVFEIDKPTLEGFTSGYFYVPEFSVKALYFYAVKVEKV